jgi:hypothetical protein
MSEAVDETPEDFASPGPNFSGERVIIRVGADNYTFESQPDGGLKYIFRTPAPLVEDDDDEPFDPSEYR